MIVFDVAVMMVLTVLLVLAWVRGSIARTLLSHTRTELAEAQARLEQGEKILLDLNAENRDLLEKLR